MNKLQTVLLCLSLLCFSQYSFAQKNTGTTGDDRMSTLESSPDDNSKFQKDRIFIGGNFGGNLSGQNTYVDISPIVGYKFTDKFMAGIGATGQFLSATVSLIEYLVERYSQGMIYLKIYFCIQSMNVFLLDNLVKQKVINSKVFLLEQVISKD